MRSGYVAGLSLLFGAVSGAAAIFGTVSPVFAQSVRALTRVGLNAELAEENGENHLAAIESDAGGFAPRGFGLDVSDAAYEQIQQWKPLFETYDLHKFNKGGSGADISALKPQGVELIGLRPDSQRYFDMHHSALDVFEIVNRRELLLGASAMTSLVYLIDQHGLAEPSPASAGTGE